MHLSEENELFVLWLRNNWTTVIYCYWCCFYLVMCCCCICICVYSMLEAWKSWNLWKLWISIHEQWSQSMCHFGRDFTFSCTHIDTGLVTIFQMGEWCLMQNFVQSDALPDTSQGNYLLNFILLLSTHWSWRKECNWLSLPEKWSKVSLHTQIELHERKTQNSVGELDS